MTDSSSFDTESRFGGTPVIVCFGDRCLNGELVAERREKVGHQIELIISADGLLRGSPDLMSRMTVDFKPSRSLPKGRRFFGGYALSLEPIDGESWRLVADSMANWADFITGGLGSQNVSMAVVLWATAREVGFAPSEMHFGGRPRREPILVCVPVEGVKPEGELDAGGRGVGLTKDPEVPARFAELGQPELQRAFSETGFWALTTVNAETMYDAEQIAVSVFESVVGRVTLATQYSFAHTPAGALRRFRRPQTLGIARIRPIAGVERLHTGSKWLRGIACRRASPLIDSTAITGLEDDIGAADEKTDEAIRSWFRASQERDATVAAVALVEALEFYSAGSRIPPMFSASDRRNLKAAANQLHGGGDPRRAFQRRRLTDVINRLNDPPLAVRLASALERDHVELTRGESKLLDRVREARRRTVHGGQRTTLRVHEMQAAVALINRILVYRLRRLRSDAS